MRAHWHILGAGSIGLLWAFYLAKAGCAVTLISRHEQQRSKEFIKLTLNGQTRSLQVDVVPTQAVNEISHLLIATKTWQTEHAVNSIREKLLPQANVLLMQNGMGNQQWLADNLPHCTVYAASCSEGALRTDRYAVTHTGLGHTEIGGINNQDATIVQALNCELSLSYQPNIESALWQKLVVNCCINPLTVIYDCVNGGLLEIPAAMQQIQQIIVECQQVAAACGMAHALVDAPERVLNVLQRTANNSSSMRQDVLLNRPSEIDAINGYIVLQGKAHGIATPLNLSLLTTIKGKYNA